MWRYKTELRRDAIYRVFFRHDFDALPCCFKVVLWGGNYNCLGWQDAISRVCTLQSKTQTPLTGICVFFQRFYQKVSVACGESENRFIYRGVQFHFGHGNSRSVAAFHFLGEGEREIKPFHFLVIAEKRL